MSNYLFNFCFKFATNNCLKSSGNKQIVELINSNHSSEYKVMEIKVNLKKYWNILQNTKHTQLGIVLKFKTQNQS